MKINRTDYLPVNWSQPAGNNQPALAKTENDIAMRVNKLRPFKDQASAQDAEFTELSQKKPLTSIDIYA